MSLAADYSAALACLQRCGLTGGNPTNDERTNLLSCIRAQATAVTAINAAITTANGLVATQTTALTAIGGASATASTAIIAAMATLVAAKPTASTLVANSVIDGPMP